MDVIFSCQKCEQELAVDSSGAGSEINCPSCNALIVIPELPAQAVSGGGGPSHADPHRASAMASSAAAKVELHLKVASNKAPESLIAKPLATLEVAAKESDRKMKVKTIKHTDCIEVGHDRFDEMVSNFLIKVGESHIVSISSINYSHVDIGSQKILTDYGVMIIYKG